MEDEESPPPAPAAAPSAASERTPLTATSSRRSRWRRKLLYIAARHRLMDTQEVPAKGWKDGTKALLTGTKLNLLLFFALFLPFSNQSATFIFASLVLLPLAALLGEVTEKVAYHTSETIGGLLNATFGNATEAMVSVFALRKGLVRVVQVSLIGSVLSNMLLVLGSAFFAAGMRVKLAHFNKTAASANTGLLLVAVLALLVPAMLEAAHEISRPDEFRLSRSTSILLLVIYAAYLNFQLSSHSKIFDEEAEDARNKKHQQQNSPSGQPYTNKTSFASVAMAALARMNSRNIDKGRKGEIEMEGEEKDSFVGKKTTKAGANTSEDDEDDEEYVLEKSVALGWLAIITVVVACFSELLTNSLEAFSEQFELPDSFVGFVLLPIVGNAAEHATAISMAYRSKMDLAVAVALGSSTQIALFVLPLMVVIAWIMGEPLDLAFGSFETAVTAFSVVIVAAQAQMGEVHYLNGICLVVAYCIISLAFYYIHEPSSNPSA